MDIDEMIKDVIRTRQPGITSLLLGLGLPVYTTDFEATPAVAAHPKPNSTSLYNSFYKSFFNLFYKEKRRILSSVVRLFVSTFSKLFSGNYFVTDSLPVNRSALCSKWLLNNQFPRFGMQKSAKNP